MRCVARLATPTDRCGAECSGLSYTCPLCRHSACISHLHMLVMLKGSWAEALRCFPCSHTCEAWSFRRPMDADSEETATTEEDEEDDDEMTTQAIAVAELAALLDQDDDPA